MGALDANAKKISRFLTEAKSKGADLTVFPELALLGYPPNDLLEQEGFLDQVQEKLEELAKKHSDQSFVIGTVEKGGEVGKGRWNSAAFVNQGKIETFVRKRLLPTYDVFDEIRYFDEGEENSPIDFQGKKIGITICEDIWTEEELGRKLYRENPVRD